MTEKKYFPEMDRLRGIAILMVLLYHSIIVYPVDLTSNRWCELLHFALWMIEMPIFFLVAGFCFRYEGHYGSYLKKKALRILVPHFVFGILDMLLRIVPNPLVNEVYPWDKACRELFLYASNDWFLWTLFLLFLIAPLMAKWIQKGVAARAVLFLAALVLFLIQNIITPLFALKNVACFMVYFVLGMLLRYRSENRRGKNLYSSDVQAERKEWIRKWLYIALGMIGGCLLFWMLQWEGWSGYDEIWRLKFGVWIQPVISVLTIQFYPAVTLLKMIKALFEMATVLLWMAAFYQLACLVREGIVARFLKICSHYSLQMYLLNGYALVLTRTLLVSVLGVGNPMMIILGNFILDTLIVLIVSRYILDRWRILRMLSGLGRSR